MAIPVGKWVEFSHSFSFPSRSGKVLRIPALLSSVFVRRVLCSYVWSASGGSRNAYILSGGHSRIFN